ncbi:MAG: hypothetical protein EA357_01285 [Micavibrio sp.]|nr:MAG: hypothetical protein EA357_01285 [Micavibrio sp.]
MFLALSGCRTTADTDKDGSFTSLHRALAEKNMSAPAPEHFLICHGYGCRRQSPVALSSAEWRQIRNLFHPPSRNAAEERQRISEAVGLMERFSGAQTGTDRNKAGTFQAAFRNGQMDCEDEMMNAAMYFTLFAQHDLIRYHRLAGEAHRGFFLGGWPHRAVRLEDTENGDIYVLDSWFHDNGHPAEILPYTVWRGGWRPAKEIAKE